MRGCSLKIFDNAQPQELCCVCMLAVLGRRRWITMQPLRSCSQLSTRPCMWSARQQAVKIQRLSVAQRQHKSKSASKRLVAQHINHTFLWQCTLIHAQCTCLHVNCRTHLLRLLARGGPCRTANTPALGRGLVVDVATSPTANTLEGPPSHCRLSLILTNPCASA